MAPPYDAPQNSNHCLSTHITTCTSLKDMQSTNMVTVIEADTVEMPRTIPVMSPTLHSGD